MAEQGLQTRENHVRFDPLFHFTLMPASFALFVWSVVRFTTQMNGPAAFLMALALVLFLTVFLVRIYSLRVQDRVIRLEESLRLARLQPGVPLPDLRPGQWVALRFASDAEMPALAAKAAAGNLPGKEIKAAIQNWRPDYFRV